MKFTQLPLVTALLAGICAFILQPGAALAQGPLTPPGAPAPSFKTLSEIEPRRPFPPCRSITNNADTVTLDLKGSNT